MAATLPLPDQCCVTCPSTTTSGGSVAPGPPGDKGDAGDDGTNGSNAFSILTQAFTMPAELATAQATVDTTAWMPAGEMAFVESLGYLRIVSVDSATLVTLRNVEDTPSSTMTVNAVPGTIAPINSKVTPAGEQGPGGTGSLSGPAGGDLKGTYPNPKIGLNNARGALAVGNATDDVALAAGASGYGLWSDVGSFAATAIGWKKTQPITGDPDTGDNVIPRLDGGAGFPIPIQPSKMVIQDSGAIQSTGTGGDPRGLFAVDLQTSRVAASQVASGNDSVICGGERNTASDVAAVCVGGSSNQSLGNSSFVGGGLSNIAGTAALIGSVVVGGDSNRATQQFASILGGQLNRATGTFSTVGGGFTNLAQSTYSFIGGGSNNATDAGADRATIAGGDNNVVNSSLFGSILGGSQNFVNGVAYYASVLGGSNNWTSAPYSVASGKDVDCIIGHYGVRAHSAGMFAARGDAQVLSLLWRIATTDATANVEMYLDGAGATSVATIPNNSSWAFDILLTAFSSTHVDTMLRAIGGVRNVGGVTLVSGLTLTTVYDNIGVGGLTVDSTAGLNGYLRLRVTGKGATNIRWHAEGRIVSVTYP